VTWRGPRIKGEYPTLGYLVGEWIEANCVIPDGPRQGRPYRLTDEMWLFLIKFYRLHPDAVVEDDDPSAPFYYRGALLMRPQKWGKGPFAGTICLAEAFGPTQFAGWDRAGEPIGRRRATPWIQLVAISEEQTDNTWLSLYEEATRGPLQNEPGVDFGIQDFNLPDGGKIEPRTSSGQSRLGARITFAVFDESGLMLEGNGGVKLATTMKRNLSAMGGRWIETSNAYDPSERSIAQRTHESRASDVLVDYRPARKMPDLANREESLAELEYVYGDSSWVPLDRVYADAKDPGVCPSPGDAYRFFFNLITVGQSDPTIWAKLARPRDLQPGEAIALGFDGSRTTDCTALMASRISDGRWFKLGIWDPADSPDHRVPRHEVDEIVKAAFEAYDVPFLYGDPYIWQEYFDLWSSRWPDRVVIFETNVERRMDNAISRFLAAVKEGLTHDGDPLVAAHVSAAALARGGRKRPRPEEDPSIVQHYLKVTKKRGGHIDAVVAGILAEQARGKAIEEGVQAVAWRPL
jgi:hypothetical protein